jgi:peptide/nickel transport system permease protein
MSESQTAAAAAATKEKHPPFFIEVTTRLVREKPLATFGGVIVLVVFLAAIFAGWPPFADLFGGESTHLLAPYGSNIQDWAARLEGPSGKYLLGTDNLGRDLLSRIIYGAQISMVVGLAVPAIQTVLNLLIGGVAAYLGGRTDMIVQRFVDVVMSFPGLVIMLTVVAITGPGLTQVILLLGILGGIGAGNRVIRSAVIGVKQNVYVEAARAVGAPDRHIMLKHILPNVMPVVIIGFTWSMGSAILAEATLSFLGYGIPPPAPSWGGMLSGPARSYMLQAPWMAIWPGLALAVVVYGMNMLGDGLRDILDPRLRGGLGRYGRTKVGKKNLVPIP